MVNVILNIIIFVCLWGEKGIFLFFIYLFLLMIDDDDDDDGLTALKQPNNP